jgi:hypothetical protein
MSWLSAAGNAPFVIALLVMCGLAAVELIAVFTGFSVNDVVDELVVPHAGVDTAGNAPTGMETTSADGPGVIGRFLAWMYVGKVPVLMVLIVLLTVFGLGGLILQGAVRSIFGAALPSIVAAPLVLFALLPVVRFCTASIARVMPRDETSAVDPRSFIGRTARITAGVAKPGMPAEGRLTDKFGTDHHILVEPEDASDSFPTGSVVLLVRQTGGGRFSAIANPNDVLVDQE